MPERTADLIHRNCVNAWLGGDRRNPAHMDWSSGVVALPAPTEREKSHVRAASSSKAWPLIDREIADSGVILLKYWLEVSTDEMFAETDTEPAPWYVVPSDDKRHARLNLITHLLSKIPYNEPQA